MYLHFGPHVCRNHGMVRVFLQIFSREKSPMAYVMHVSYFASWHSFRHVHVVLVFMLQVHWLAYAVSTAQ